MHKKLIKSHDVMASCVCGCSVIRLAKLANNDKVYLMFYEDAFYGRDKKTLSSYIARLWKAIRGKEHLLFDVVLSPRDALRLERELAKMNKENEE